MLPTDLTPSEEFIVSDPSGLPAMPANPTEELRQEMRRLAKADLYYLTKIVLGYTKLVPHVHLPMCRFADRAKAMRRLMLMPRTHFKTTIWTIAQTIKDVINDPNVTILMIADTGTNASRFMREIQQHFEMNEVFRWLFSEIIPENFNTTIWSQTEMVVPRDRICREPTVDAIGALGGSESRHYDIIRADDLITEKCIRSDVEMDKTIEWAGGLESLLNMPVDEHQIDFVGSRKKKGDLYEQQQKRYGTGFESVEIGPHATQYGDLAVFWRRDIENGKPIFPEGVTMKFLMRLKKWDPARYHAQYANSPKGTGLNTFEGEDLRFWNWSADRKLIQCKDPESGEMLLQMSPFAGERIIFYDPARAEKRGSSQQAIIVALKGTHPFRIVLETHIGHFPVDEAVQLLFDLNKKWRPMLVSVEYRGFQGALRNWAYEKSEREKLEMPPMLQWPPEGSPKAQWAKDEHIKAMQPLARNHMIWLHASQVELTEQFEFHPNIRYDDGLDALSHGDEYWPAMIDELDYIEATKQEINEASLALGIFPQADMEEMMDEMAILSQLNGTGYRFRHNFN